MIFLCSDGFTSTSLTAAFGRYAPPHGKAALVVTADPEYKEQNRHVPRSQSELEGFGLSVEIVDIDKTDAAMLLSYDAVEFIGGNPFYLMHAIRRDDAEAVLQKLAQDKVLIGWSAAAMVFGSSLALAKEYTPEINFVGLTEMSGLCLSQTTILPHYSRFIRRYDRFEERCALYEQKSGRTVLRLNDGEGIIDFDGSITVIRN